MEIERKFLVKNLKDLNINLGGYEHKYIRQNYLYKDLYTAIRKRLVIDNTTRYFYTIKTNKEGYSVNEIESEISEEDFYNIKLNKNYNEIVKTRYIIPYYNYKIELDVFESDFEGIIFAEVEFKSLEEAMEFDKIIPKWFGPEISNYLTNSEMATSKVEEVFEKINKLKDDK